MELCVGRRIGSGGNRARIGEEDASFFTEFHHEDWELMEIESRKNGITVADHLLPNIQHIFGRTFFYFFFSLFQFNN